jgi:hypothetical protein
MKDEEFKLHIVDAPKWATARRDELVSRVRYVLEPAKIGKVSDYD